MNLVTRKHTVSTSDLTQSQNCKVLLATTEILKAYRVTFQSLVELRVQGDFVSRHGMEDYAYCAKIANDEKAGNEMTTSEEYLAI